MGKQSRASVSGLRVRARPMERGGSLVAFRGFRMTAPPVHATMRLVADWGRNR